MEDVGLPNNWRKYTPAGFSTDVYQMGQQNGYLCARPMSERSALEDYTGGESLWINRACRQDIQMEQVTGPQRQQLLKQGDDLSELVQSAPPLEATQVVFRGADRGPPPGTTVWTKNDFTSTRNRWSEADDFREGDCCMWIIQISRGANVLEIGDCTTSAVWDEGEVLLDRNSSFRIDKVHRQDETTYYYMTLKKRSRTGSDTDADSGAEGGGGSRKKRARLACKFVTRLPRISE